MPIPRTEHRGNQDNKLGKGRNRIKWLALALLALMLLTTASAQEFTGTATGFGGDVTVINRTTRQTGIDYFVNNGALLCFPEIAEADCEDLRRHVHLASFDGAFVHFGPETSRDEINARYRQSWESAIASGDSDAFSLLRKTRFATPDASVPIVLRR